MMISFAHHRTCVQRQADHYSRATSEAEKGSRMDSRSRLCDRDHDQRIVPLFQVCHSKYYKRSL